MNLCEDLLPERLLNLLSPNEIESAETMLRAIPGHTEVPDLVNPMVYAHYTWEYSDWFIVAYAHDINQLYGFVILNGNYDLAEFGYIAPYRLLSDPGNNAEFNLERMSFSLSREFADNPEYHARFDLNFKPKPLSECLGVKK